MQANGTLGATEIWQTKANWGTKTVTGLSSGTSYSFVVRARNGAGTTTADSSAGTASTSAAATAPVLTTGSASSITQTAATLAGNVSADGGAAVSERGFVYSTTDTTPTIAEGATNQTTTGTTGAMSQGISGLTANTTYYYNAYAINSVGTTYGTASSFTTLPNAPSAPATPTGGSVTTTDFTVSWTAVSGAVDYRLDVSTASNFATNLTNYNDLTVAGTSQAVSGLTAGTTYYVRVRAVNTGGTSSSSASLTQITVPAQAATPTSSSVAAYSFTANWAATTGAASYLLDVSTNNTFSSFVSGYNALSVSGTNQAVTNLSSGTTYYARVRAVNSGGTGANSANLTVTTLTVPGGKNPDSANPTTSFLGDQVTLGAQAWQNFNSNARSYATVFGRYGDANLTTGTVENSNANPGSSADAFTVVAPKFTQTGNFYWAIRVSYGAGNNYWYDASRAGWSDLGLSAPTSSPLVIAVSALNNPTTLAVTASNTTSITLSWARGVSGNAKNTMIVRSTDASFTAPTGGSSYAVGNTSLGGDTVIYNDSGTSFQDTGLTSGTTYYYKFYAENYSYYSAGDTLTSATAAPTPTISTSGTLAALTTTYGTNSSNTSFSASGTDLAGDISVTPPSGFEVSTNTTTGFASSLTLARSSGAVSATTIYVRLAATASAGSKSGNIVLASSNATSVNVATVASTVNTKSLTISGVTAQNKTFDNTTAATLTGTPSYVGLANGESFSVTGTATATFADANVGNAKAVTVSGYTAPSANYTVTQPSLSANITAATPTIASAPTASAITKGGQLSFSSLSGGSVTGVGGASVAGSFAFTSPTTVATSTGSQGVTFTPTSSNYSTATTTVSVTVNPVPNPATVAAVSGGTNSVNLTHTRTNGISVLIVRKQGTAVTWSPTDGQNYADNADVGTGHTVIKGSAGADSSSDSGLSPNTTYHYKVFSEYYGYYSTGTATSATTDPLPPSVSISSGTLAFGRVLRTATAAEQSYTVSGSNLTADLTITAPTGFQVSTTSGSGFGSSVTLTPSSGSVASTTIYVRYAPTADGSQDGNITHASSGLTTANKAVTGSGRNLPEGINPATANATTAFVGDTVPLTVGTWQTWNDLSLTNRARSFATVFGRFDNADLSVSANCVQGTGRDPGSSTDEFFANTPTLTQAGTFYWTMRVSYGFENDFWFDASRTGWSMLSLNRPSAASLIIAVSALNNPSSLVATAVATNQVTLTWTKGNSGGEKDTLVLRNTSNSFTDPTAGTAYTAGATIGGATVVYKGNASTVTDSNLATGTQYFYKVYAENNSYYSPSTSGTVTASATTLSPAISLSGTLAAVNTTYGTASSTTSFTASGTNLTGNLTVTPPDGYEVSTSLGSNYGSTVNLTASSGTVASTTVYVRLAANTVPGTYSGNITVSGGGATSQTIATVLSTVAAKQLTITGITGANKVYDGTNAATVTGTASLVGVNGSDTVTLSGTPTYTFADASVGTGKAITASGHTLGGTHAGRYSLQQATGLTANITAKALTGYFTASGKEYDGSTSATVSGRSLTGVVGSDDVSLSGGTATFANKSVGTGKIVTLADATLSGTASGNYTLSSVSTTTASITAKALTIGSPSVTASKAYDGNTTASATAGSLSGVVSGDTVTASATATYDTAAVGSSKTITVNYSLSGADSGNYTAPGNDQVTNGAITAKALTIGAPSLTSSKTYDGSTTAAVTAGSLNGVVGTETVTASATAVYASASAGTNKTITVSYSLSGTHAGNYSAPANDVVTNGVINAKGLEITGLTGVNKVYDGSTSASATGTAALSGVISADAGDVAIAGSPSFSFADANVGAGKPISANGYSLDGSAAGNYSLTQPTLSADITAKALTISGATASNRVYDRTSTVAVSGGSLVGVIGSDDVTLGGSPAGATANANVGTGKSVTVTGYSISGGAAGNYSLSQPTGVTVNITARELTVTGATATNRAYNGSTTVAVSGGSLSGVITGDTVTLGGSPAGTVASADAGTGKSVTVTGYTIGGAQAANYNLTQPTDVTVDISAATLAGSEITLNQSGDSFIASATGVSGFTYSYVGRTSNGIATSYGPSATAPTAPGYYTVTATSSDSNYSGSASSNYHVTGPIAANDAVARPAGNTNFGIPQATLVQNDKRIDSSGNVQTSNLSVTGVTATGPTVAISGVMVNFTSRGAGAETFTYTVTDTTTSKTATATVTVTPENSVEKFEISGTPGTPSFDGDITSVTMTFTGTPNTTYTVYYKGELSDATWKSAGAFYSETSTFTVEISEDGDHRTDWSNSMFFRAVK